MSLYNLARVVSATAGTGTLTLGAAVSGCLTFANAGVSDGAQVSYGISDGVNSEVGRGTYTSAGTTLSRDTVLASTNSGAKINCSGNEQVFITALAEDFTDRDSGWISANQTWTYVSAHSFQVTGDITANLWKGRPVRWKQGGAYNYGNIISFTYSAPNTTIALALNDVYTVANSAITNNDYGLHASPVGFPDIFVWSTGCSPTGFSGTPSKSFVYSFAGAKLTCHVAISGTSNATGFTCALPAPVYIATYMLYRAQDNTSTLSVGMAVPAASTMTFYPSVAAGTWTNSNTKAADVAGGFYWI